MAGGSGRRDQSAFWCSFASFTPAYFSNSAARPIAGSPDSWAAMRVSNSRRARIPVSGCSSLVLAERVQAGGDLLQRLGEGLVKFRVRRLGRTAERIARALAGGARGVTDVVGGNHRTPRGSGLGCRIRRS